jgi:anti-sigma regulatory factor (Ser/Thr protein kinase)
VLGTGRFPASLTSPGDARRFVGGLLVGVTTAGVIAEATLLTSELVTNALVHAGSPMVVKVVVAGASFRIEVSDSGAGIPAVASVDPTAVGGRGLALVRDMSSAWGVTQHGTGKTVWFSLLAAPAAWR